MGRNFFLSSLCVLIILQSSWASDIRLPKSIVPEHYRLKMIPVLADEQFEIYGSVRIHIYIQEATDFITVHGKGINVTEVSEIRKKNEESSSFLDPDVVVVNITYDVSRDFITFQLNETLQQRERYEFSIHYKAILETNLRGLYRSSYFDRKTNETRWLAVTQMEPTDARRAFPCFDEPAMKATFEISLGRTNKMSSLSNMPLRKTEPMRLGKGWVWDHFEKSVPMSTYLVACLVSDFDFRAGEPLVRSVSPEFRETTSNVTEVRIWSRPDAVNETKLAVDTTTKMLDFLESYFQVPFPLPKVDLVAVPDFSSGAMENWGLITFRETALLFDSKEAVVRDRSNVLRIIAHELAHQWFGNLVTMKWWNDLWLNEGFASYVQDLVMVEVAPEFDFHVASSLELQYVMGPDALESSHPISVEVEHPNQITEIFDEISYKKGSAVIRMMHNFLGDETFRQGLTNYLTTLKYRNAEQDDLWRFLSEQAHADEVLPSNVDVKTIMDTWTLQKGYPFINLERSYEDSTILLRQERFVRRTSSMNDISVINVVNENGTGLREQGLDSKWWVPISMTDSASRDFSAKNTRPKLWLSPDLLSARRETAAGPDDWIVLNVGVSGYYRVNYDSKNWELISRQLLKDHQAIHTANRAQLIDDAFALAAAGILPYSRPLDLIEYLPLESHYVPWTSALRSLAYIRNMLMFTPQLGRWKSYLSSLVIPAFERIGFDITESDDPLTILAKVTLNGQACAASFKPCILRAQELFQLWQESKDPVHDLTISPDMRSTIYCNAIKYGSDSDWEFAWNMTTKVTSPQHRDVLLSALGCSREPWILIRYLSWILDEKSGVRLQDGRRIVTAVANNPVGRYLSFTFLRDNWNALVQRYASVRTPLRMLESATMLYNTPYDLSEVQSFMDQRKAELSTSSASLKKITTNIAANIQWMNANYNFIVKWMENKQL